jgi:hypothetical protein
MSTFKGYTFFHMSASINLLILSHNMADLIKLIGVPEIKEN